MKAMIRISPPHFGHLGEPISPPRLMPARGPLLWQMQDSGSDAIDPQAQPASDYEFDQRIAWWGTRRTDSLAGGRLVPVATCTANFRRPGRHRHRLWA